MIQQRSIHFAFQGLLTAVLLLMYSQQHAPTGWFGGFAILVVLLALPLLVIQLLPQAMLSQWWFQSGFFIIDAAAVSYAVRWRDPHSVAYLIYFLIILSTAMTRNFRQSIAVGVVSSVLFFVTAWSPAHGLPSGDSVFWLKFQLLIITTCLLSVLSRDAQKLQADQERRYQLRLIQAERLATLGRVAGEVAHRIKAPLTTIRVNAEVLAHKFAKSKEAQGQLAEIEQEVEHCKEILKSLLDLGRIEEIVFSPLDLRVPIRLAVDSLETQIKNKGLRMEVAGLDRPLRVRGDASLLQEAVTAVLQNAVEAGHRGGLISLRVKRAAYGGSLSVIIQDDGKGITESDLDRIFKPFFTTKGSSGNGLGLSAAMRILQKHNGAIDGSSEGRGSGACFTMTLPGN